MKKKECPFCNIAKKERILRDGKSVYVILSNPRLMPGHLLVISKRHVQKLGDLSAKERKELMDMVIEFEEKILSAYALGCDIRQNYRPFLENDGIVVKHLHIHLQPREFHDELWQKSQQSERPLFEKLSVKERDRFIQLFQD